MRNWSYLFSRSPKSCNKCRASVRPRLNWNYKGYELRGSQRKRRNRIGNWFVRERERREFGKGRERCAYLYPYIFALGASKSNILYCYLLFVFFFLVNVLSFVSCYWWKLNACSTKIKRKMLNSSKKKIIKKYIFFTQKKQKTATREPVRKETTGIERKQVAIES